MSTLNFKRRTKQTGQCQLADMCPLSSGCVISIHCVSITRDGAKQQEKYTWLIYIIQHTHQGHVSFQRADASIKKESERMPSNQTLNTGECHSHTETQEVMLSCRIMNMEASSWNPITILVANWKKLHCYCCFLALERGIEIGIGINAGRQSLLMYMLRSNILTYSI